MTAEAWIEKACGFFAQKGVAEERTNAEFIMAHVLKAGRLEVRLQRDRRLTDKQEHRFWHLCLQRSRRIPLAYVLGFQPFMDISVEVSRDVLIPRPETEELVARAVELLKSRRDETLHILEIGTGTGCIAIVLARAFPRAVIYATDISPSALHLAMKNASAHHCANRVRFILDDLFKPQAQRRGWADMLISNPPYIPTSEIPGLTEEVRREPFLALDGGKDGLKAIDGIIREAPSTLREGGWLVLEIGADQGSAVLKKLRERDFEEAEVLGDGAGRDRIALGRRAKMVN